MKFTMCYLKNQNGIQTRGSAQNLTKLTTNKNVETVTTLLICSVVCKDIIINNRWQKAKQSSCFSTKKKATVTRGISNWDTITYSAWWGHLLTGLWQRAHVFPDIFRQSKEPGIYQMSLSHVYLQVRLHTAATLTEMLQTILGKYIGLNWMSELHQIIWYIN